MDTDYENLTPSGIGLHSNSDNDSKIYNETLKAFEKAINELVRAYVTERRGNTRSNLGSLYHGLLEGKNETGLSDTKNTSKVVKSRSKSRIRRRDKGVMYLPVRGGSPSSSSCPSYADTVASSLTQMAFASMVVTVFNAVANIANNINNNNRNDNINSNSNIDSNNANIASNNNNANQVDIIIPPPIPPGRSLEFKRKREQILRLKKISKKLLELQKARGQTASTSSSAGDQARNRTLRSATDQTRSRTLSAKDQIGSRTAWSAKDQTRSRTLPARDQPKSRASRSAKNQTVSRTSSSIRDQTRGSTLRSSRDQARSNRTSRSAKHKHIFKGNPKARPMLENNRKVEPVARLVGEVSIKDAGLSGLRTKSTAKRSKLVQKKYDSSRNIGVRPIPSDCKSRKAYARAALNTLRMVQDMLSDDIESFNHTGDANNNKMRDMEKARKDGGIFKAVDYIKNNPFYKPDNTKSEMFNDQIKLFQSDSIQGKTLEDTSVVCTPVRHLCDSLDPVTKIDSKILESLVQMIRWRDIALGQGSLYSPWKGVTPGLTCLQLTSVCQS
ncbi:uncharacterized protein DDB_G0287625-like [Palaemon carinicauda]|uniref:uncharacterized protein DDB_G0287625-like n=1 Tax=Palaemon carinicauda TaxID=392227 RepID=UPI0035B6A1FA